MSTTTFGFGALIEAEEVLRWRFAVLIRAGYDPADAMAIAAEDEIDLHLATELLGRGCPPATALRILL